MLQKLERIDGLSPTWVGLMVVHETEDGLFATALSRTGSVYITQRLREAGLSLERLERFDVQRHVDPDLRETRWTEIRYGEIDHIHDILAEEDPIEEEYAPARQEAIIYPGREPVLHPIRERHPREKLVAD